MKRMTLTAVGLAVLIVGLALGASAEADWSSDGTTHLTFEHPVRVPGATLSEGSYVFTVDMNSQAVWIRREDDSHVYRTLPDTAAPTTRVDKPHGSSWSGVPRTRTVSPPSVRGSGATKSVDMSPSTHGPAATSQRSWRSLLPGVGPGTGSAPIGAGPRLAGGRRRIG